MKPLTKALKEMSESEELLRLAFEADERQPHVVPVWYTKLGQEYYCGTGRSTAKWKAIKDNPRVGWVIDSGRKGKYKGISMYGEAQEVTDKKLKQKIYNSFGEKYFGSPDSPKHKEIWGEVDDPDSVYIHLKMEDGFSWEY